MELQLQSNGNGPITRLDTIVRLSPFRALFLRFRESTTKVSRTISICKAVFRLFGQIYRSRDPFRITVNEVEKKENSFFEY